MSDKFSNSRNGSANGTAYAPVASHVASHDPAADRAAAAAAFRTDPPGGVDAAAPHHATDPVTRLRDRYGNRLPWFYSHSTPAVDDVPLAQTPLADAVDAIAGRLPIRAAELHAHYDRKLLPAVRRLVAVRAAEEEALAAQVERAVGADARADAQTEEEARPHREALAALEKPLAAAHRTAGEKVARAGGSYDPAAPTDDCVLRHTRVPEAVIAGQLRLPWTPADKTAATVGWLGWLLTALIGAMIGISVGLMSRWITVSNLADRWPVAVMLVAVGFAAAYYGKRFVFLAARRASQRYWLGLPPGEWLPAAVLAGAVAAALCAMDSYVEREGLLAGMRLQETARQLGAAIAGAGTAPLAPVDGGAGREALYTLAAMILTFGYVGTAACEGALHGRYDACLNRVRARQEELFREEDAARRADPAVQEALAALADVRRLLGAQRALEGQIAAVVAAADALRLPLPEGLSDEAKRRIQDALDQLNGTQTNFDEMFSLARAECEGGTGAGQRLWRALRGPGAGPRHTGRERKRPLN